MRSKYPLEVEKGILVPTGHQVTRPMAFNVLKTEQTLGIEFIPFEEQVKSVVDHYIELVSPRGRSSM